MGAGAFHVRVRDGIGCRVPAIATRSSNPPNFVCWVICLWVSVLVLCVRLVCWCDVQSVHHVDDCCAWGVRLSLSGD